MEQPGHADFLCDNSRAHVLYPPNLTTASYDLDIHASREVELHQRVDGLGGRINDVEEPLVRADFELVTRFLVHVGAHAER